MGRSGRDYCNGINCSGVIGNSTSGKGGDVIASDVLNDSCCLVGGSGVGVGEGNDLACCDRGSEGEGDGVIGGIDGGRVDGAGGTSDKNGEECRGRDNRGEALTEGQGEV